MKSSVGMKSCISSSLSKSSGYFNLFANSFLCNCFLSPGNLESSVSNTCLGEMYLLVGFGTSVSPKKVGMVAACSYANFCDPSRVTSSSIPKITTMAKKLPLTYAPKLTVPQYSSGLHMFCDHQ